MHPKLTHIPAGQFKTHCLQLLDKVKQSHIEFIITKHGKPYAKLIPIEEKSHSLFGCLNNSVVIQGDIINGTGETWDAETE